MSSNYWPTCYVQSLQEVSRGTVFCSYFIASLQTFLIVTPNAIVKHRRIRIATSKEPIIITSFCLELFGLQGLIHLKWKLCFFLLLELFEIYLHFALWNFVLSIPHVLSPGTFCHRQHPHAKRLKCCKKDFKIFVFLVLTRLSQNLVSLHVEKMFANIRKFRNNFTGFINRNKIIFRIFHKYLRSHASPEKFFQGGPCCHFSYPFHVADDAMQIGVHKTLYHFYTTNEMVHVAAWVKKIRFVGSKATMGFGKGRRWPSFILKFNIFH